MNKCPACGARMIIRVGVPATGGGLWDAACAEGAPVLVSAGALWNAKRKRFNAPGVPAWLADVALDSGGFVAMRRFGGYRWTVDQYVDLVVRGRALLQRPTERDDDIGGWGPPWAWWAAMDFCCEPEVAGDRCEVLARVDRTVELFVDCVGAAEAWRAEGVTDLADPMPILQGWRPDDYLRCAEGIEAALRATNSCSCSDEGCRAEWHRPVGLPDLVGVGSVCRRELGGPDGLEAVLRALDCALPKRVRLHLFGVKSEAVGALRGHPRIASVDSMAWDFGARRTANGEPNTVERRAGRLSAWYRGQLLRRDAGQLRLLL